MTRILIASVCLFLASAMPASAQITVRFMGSGVTASPVSGAAVENFDSGMPGNAIGTYTSLPGIVTTPSAGAFGGAGGAGHYLNVTDGSVSIALNAGAATSYSYFGLYVSAADTDNIVSFFRTDAPVFTFRVEDLLNANVLSGQSGTTGGHFGNPDSPFVGQNNTQAYVFLNFYADGVAGQFDRVELSEPGVGGFESDNHTASATMFVFGEQFGTQFTPVPEPAGLLALAALALGVARRLR